LKLVWYLLVMAGVTYFIRALPFVLCREKVKSTFLQYFFAYIPYAVLAAMTLPHMLFEGESPLSACAGLLTAVILSVCRQSLIVVAAGASVAAFLAAMLL